MINKIYIYISRDKNEKPRLVPKIISHKNASIHLVLSKLIKKFDSGIQKRLTDSVLSQPLVHIDCYKNEDKGQED